MPELPEVQTTVNGLNQTIVGLRIVDVWSDYDSVHFFGKETIKDPPYFKKFRKEIIGQTVTSVSRRAKNVLIHLTKSTVLVHMKMTGHLLYGKYKFDLKNKKDPWNPISPDSLKDSYNRHVHFVISFSDGHHLALSDVRKFAKVALLEHCDIKDIGPEPLDSSFTFQRFVERINLHKHWKIKQVLLDQKVIAGIGNIYADESLWLAGIHPAQRVDGLSSRGKPKPGLRLLFLAIKKSLARGVSFGGDSMSDYRNVYGEKGEFQNKHHAYQKTGMKCDKRGCGGTIRRIKLAGRGTHFCDRHQKLLSSTLSRQA